MGEKKIILDDLYKKKDKIINSFMYKTKLPKDRAEDIFSKSTIKIIEKIEKGGFVYDEKKFIAYTRKVMFRTFLDEKARNDTSRNYAETKKSLIKHEKNFNQNMFDEEMKILIKSCLEKLPDNLRRVMLDRGLGFKQRETAITLNVSPNTIADWAVRAGRLMRACVKGKQEALS